jgi:hypothetical protein
VPADGGRLAPRAACHPFRAPMRPYATSLRAALASRPFALLLWAWRAAAPLRWQALAAACHPGLPSLLADYSTLGRPRSQPCVVAMGLVTHADDSGGSPGSDRVLGCEAAQRARWPLRPRCVNCSCGWSGTQLLANGSRPGCAD